MPDSPPDKAAILAELRRRAAGNEQKLAVVSELERRAGLSKAPLKTDIQEPDRLLPEQVIQRPGKDYSPPEQGYWEDPYRKRVAEGWETGKTAASRFMSAEGLRGIGRLAFEASPVGLTMPSGMKEPVRESIGGDWRQPLIDLGRVASVPISVPYQGAMKTLDTVLGPKGEPDVFPTGPRQAARKLTSFPLDIPEYLMKGGEHAGLSPETSEALSTGAMFAAPIVAGRVSRGVGSVVDRVPGLRSIPGIQDTYGRLTRPRTRIPSAVETPGYQSAASYGPESPSPAGSQKPSLHSMAEPKNVQRVRVEMLEEAIRTPEAERSVIQREMIEDAQGRTRVAEEARLANAPRTTAGLLPDDLQRAPSPEPVEATPGTRPELFDQSGLPRTPGAPVQRMSNMPVEQPVPVDQMGVPRTPGPELPPSQRGNMPIEPTQDVAPQLFDEMGLRRTQVYDPVTGQPIVDRPRPAPAQAQTPLEQPVAAPAASAAPQGTQVPSVAPNAPEAVIGGPEALPAPRTATPTLRTAAAKPGVTGEFVEGQTTIKPTEGGARGRAGRSAEARALAESAASKLPQVMDAIGEQFPEIRARLDEAVAAGDVTKLRTLMSALEPEQVATLIEKSGVSAAEFYKVTTGKSRVPKAVSDLLKPPSSSPPQGGGLRRGGKQSGQVFIGDLQDVIRRFSARRQANSPPTPAGGTGVGPLEITSLKPQRGRGSLGIFDLREGFDAFKRLGTAGAPLGHALRRVDERTLELSNNDLLDFHRARNKLSTDERKWLDNAQTNGIKVLEGRAPAPTKGIQEFVDWWRSFQDVPLNRFEEQGGRLTTGEKVTRLGESYFPMKPSGAYLDAQAAKQAEIPEGTTAEDWQGYRAPGLKSLNRAMELERTAKLEDQFRHESTFETIEEYIRRGASSAAEQEFLQFRNKDGTPNNGLQGNLGKWLNQIGKEGYDMDSAAQAVNEVLGKTPTPEFERQAGNAIGTGVAAAKYGFVPSTAMRQSTTLANVTALLGPEGTARAAARLASEYKRVHEIAERAGAIRPLRRFGETAGILEGGPSHRGQPVGPMGRALSLGRKVVGGASDLGFAALGGADLQGRLLAVAGAEDFAATMNSRLKGSKYNQGRAKSLLEGLDYTPDEIAVLADKGFRQADMNTLRQRLVRRSSGETTKGQRIPFAEGTKGRLATAGLGFSIQSTRNFYRVPVRQLIYGKDPLPLMAYIGTTLLVGKGLIEAQKAMFGPSKYEEDSWREGGGAGIIGDAATAVFSKDKKAFDRYMEGVGTPMWLDFVRKTWRHGRGIVDGPNRSKALEDWVKSFKSVEELDAVLEKLSK